jgi:hypothetical protein
VKKNDVTQDQIENLADALTEDILNTQDDELLREVAEDYGDPRALANKFDQILERAEKQVFGMARHVVPALGARPLQQIRPTEIDALYQSSRARSRLAPRIMSIQCLARASRQRCGKACSR